MAAVVTQEDLAMTTIATHQDDLLAEIESRLPPEFRERVRSLSTDSEAREGTSLSILVAGITGVGKSTLVNGIIGSQVARVDGVRRTGCSAEVLEYRRHDIKGVTVNVWDSPGLRDGSGKESDYLAEMRAKCSDVDLVLYCIKMTETRFTSDNSDVLAMKKLTEVFGEEFWKRIVVLLTFANSVEYSDSSMIAATSPRQKKEIFDRLLTDRKQILADVLKHDLQLPPEIADKVCIVTAGHEQIPKLPGHDRYWLSNLWRQCFMALPTYNSALALLTINQHRIVTAGQERESDLQQSIEKQPIVLYDTDDSEDRSSSIITLILALLRKIFRII